MIFYKTKLVIMLNPTKSVLTNDQTSNVISLILFKEIG